MEEDRGLTCRLLCASELAYEIGEDWSNCAAFRLRLTEIMKWTGPPTAIKGPTVGPMQPIDAALVGENIDGIIVAFRGTLPPIMSHSAAEDARVLHDWLQDAMVVPQEVTETVGDREYRLGVHSGFNQAFGKVCKRVFRTIRDLKSGRDLKIYVTGHSKCGALATLCSWQLYAEGLKPAATVTFAAPRVGDLAFANAYADANINHIRYENNLDIVPLLPAENRLAEIATGLTVSTTMLPFWSTMLRLFGHWAYKHVGVLRYIPAGSDGSYAPAAAPTDNKRMGEILVALSKGKVRSVLQAHLSVRAIPNHPEFITSDNTYSCIFDPIREAEMSL